MTRGLFEGIPLPVVLVATAAGFFAAAELGYRFGVRILRLRPPGSLADLGTTLAGLLGLLGLLLAFTFGMAGARFDDRKTLVIEEANAIGTAWLRADLVPDPMRTQARAALRDYAQSRLDASAAGGAAARNEAIARAERLHGSLWAITVAAATAAPSPTVALFVSAVNEVIDMHARRLAASTRNPIPPTIFGTLYVVSLLVLVALGYSRGLTGDRSALATLLLSVVLAVVLALILDLDRPGEGYLRVDQQAMREVRASMGP